VGSHCILSSISTKTTGELISGKFRPTRSTSHYSVGRTGGFYLIGLTVSYYKLCRSLYINFSVESFN